MSTLEWTKTSLGKLRHSFESLIQDGLEPVDGHAVPDDFDNAIVFVIDVQSQTLFCLQQGVGHSTYQVSTASNGVGCDENTGCTPVGWHRIANKIGHNYAAGTIFKGRQVVGVTENFSSTIDDDLITSRILWLAGLQHGLNQGGRVDSYSRYIYIHGTAQEQLIGKPVSHGCIRMRNDDVIKLFEIVDQKSVVYITPDIRKEFHN